MELYDYIMDYLKNNFNFGYSNSFVRNTFSNFIDYAIENFNNSENQLAHYLSNMIDELEFKDIKKVISNFEEDKRKFYERKAKNEKIVNYEKNEFNIPIIDKVEKAIKNEEDYSYYDEMKVNYIMIDNNNPSQSYAVVELDYDYLVMVYLENMEMHDIADYAYTIDDDIYGELESGKELAYMSLDFHYGIWQDVHYYYPEDIEHKDGLKMYLQYCKDHKIDMDLLNEVMDANKFDENLCDFVNSKNQKILNDEESQYDM